MWHFDPGLFDEIDVGGIGIVGRVVDFDDFSIVEGKSVDDAGSCRDDGEIEFAV